MRIGRQGIGADGSAKGRARKSEAEIRESRDKQRLYEKRRSEIPTLPRPLWSQEEKMPKIRCPKNKVCPKQPGCVALQDLRKLPVCHKCDNGKDKEADNE